MEFRGNLVYVQDDSYGHYRDDLSRFWCACGRLANNYFRDNYPLHQFMCPKCAEKFYSSHPDAVEGI